MGINTGIASIGVGSDNTALGDAVNTAFRLETASKELGVDIVVNESSCDCLPEEMWCELRTEVRLKGKREAVSVVGLDFVHAENLLSGRAAQG